MWLVGRGSIYASFCTNSAGMFPDSLLALMYLDGRIRNMKGRLEQLVHYVEEFSQQG
jgi:hypothetical protein